MEVELRNWRIWLPMMALSVVLAVAMVWGFWTGVQNRDLVETISTNRAQRIAQINKVNYTLCLRIERLFTARRQEANERYHNLERDARLLNIKITPELRRTAQQARAATIARFSPRPCSRQVVNERELP